MTILMEALGYQNYSGKWYVRGETIPVACESDASDMVVLGLARRTPLAVPEETRAMVAETEDSAMAGLPAKEAKKEVVPPPKRGQYLHRAARTPR
jgi:hypothetical protein